MSDEDNKPDVLDAPDADKQPDYSELIDTVTHVPESTPTGEAGMAVVRGAGMADDENSNAKKRGRVFGMRNFFFETHDATGAPLPNAPTEEEWKKKTLDELVKVCDAIGESIAIIYHDKDKDKKRKPKGLHLHFVMRFKARKAKTLDYFIAEFKKACGFDLTSYGPQTKKNFQLVNNVRQAYKYLIHISEKALKDKKHIYDVSEVIVYSRVKEGDKYVLKRLDKDMANAFMQHAFVMTDKDLQKGEGAAVTPQTPADFDDVMELLIRCGKITVDEVRHAYEMNPLNIKHEDETVDLARFMRKHKRFDAARDEYMHDVEAYYASHDRALLSVFLEGPGGIGKSTLARRIAEEFAGDMPIHNVSAVGSTTFDPADGYIGNRAVIVNEAPGGSFGLEQFLQLADPTNSVPAASRNKNKPWYPSFMLFTTSVFIEQWIKDMYLPYVREVLRGAPDINGPLKSSDWDRFYSSEKYIDRIRQLRRRLPIWVQMAPVPDMPNKVAVQVSVLESNDAKMHANVSPRERRFRLDDPFRDDTYVGIDMLWSPCYTSVRTMVVDTVEDEYNVDPWLPVVVAIRYAIEMYYKWHPEYRRTRAEFPPTFSPANPKILEAPRYSFGLNLPDSTWKNW